jgi:hypothetical protein
MVRLMRSLFCPLLVAPLAAQSAYFQQETNYTIAVTLDDTRHLLSGQISIEYTNHAPETLSEIRMHLWANAFNGTNTAFGRQKLRDGSTGYHFADNDDLGYYTQLDFTVDGTPTTWKPAPNNPDIVYLSLAKPLQPGQTIVIATPFQLKIPASFSRLGHVGTSYQMTQWYPKPAVYDHKGWHDMPYLDIGEFYSEFGRFDVTITLPDNYVVGATGTLQTPAELAFLQEKEKETRLKLGRIQEKEPDTFPPSSARMKTIRYTAEQVHDFAWFADKRFMVLKDTARLTSGRTVDCWAMFTHSSIDSWKKGAFFVRRAVEFYSACVGEYPWPHATAVHAALSAGGGMEYPMITVIGDETSAKGLDDVICHEVGHNWFYGILASNERVHPFMDEGLNSYYEQRYMEKYYGSNDYSEAVGLPKKWYNAKQLGPFTLLGYQMLARQHQDTPPDTHSADIAPIAYGLQVYMKTALATKWLENAVGTARFDAAMQAYYKEWKFRHPYPDDLRTSWEKAGLNADWWFRAIQTTEQSDFCLKRIRKTPQGYELNIQNKGDLDAPFTITAYRKGEEVFQQWYPEGTSGAVQTEVPEADAFTIDAGFLTQDVCRKNNTRRTRGLFPGFEPIKIKNLAFFENGSKSTLGVLPWVGWNRYDNTQVGLVLYNPPLPGGRFQYFLAPGYGMGSRRLTGLADIRYSFYPGGLLQKITAGLSAKTFTYRDYKTLGFQASFYRIVPELRLELRDRSLSFRHWINLRLLQGNTEGPAFDTTFVLEGKKWRANNYFEVRYELTQKKQPNPYKLTLAIEHQLASAPGYWRGTLEWRQKMAYKQGRYVGVRFFAGYFLQNLNRNRGVQPYALTLNPQGFNDYRFDQLFFGRSETEGLLSRQVSQTDGGFKNAFGAPFAGVLGNSNNFILALNLKADLPQRLPFGLPLKPWFDIGYFDDATALGANRPLKEQLLWSGGMMLEILKGTVEIYFPLVNARPIRDRYCEQSGGTNGSALFCGGNYLKWISWSIRLPLQTPTEAIEYFVR